MIVRKIADYIDSNRLLTDRQPVLAAVSGGADSVALLHILAALGYRCEAAHCNFHLRGEESDRDEQFVTAMCHQMDIPLHTVHFDTESYANQHKISIEMAARELRYRWFEEQRKACNAQAIAVAHHQDDSVETILLNLARGSGITGLQGIHPRNGHIVRPLLCVTRKELTDYLQAQHQTYVTDSTNLQDVYARNKIRLGILPLMCQINAAAPTNIANTGRYLSDVAVIYKRYIEEATARIMNGNAVSITTLLNEPIAESVLFEILHPIGFNSRQVHDILANIHGQAGKTYLGKEGFRLLRDRDRLLIEKIQTDETDTPPFKLHYKTVNKDGHYIIPREKNTIAVDAQKISGMWKVRKWRTGDSFIPFGMKGRKLLSDFMTDRKYTATRKKEQWLLCNNGEIVWVIGERMDNRYRIDETTQQVIEISIQD